MSTTVYQAKKIITMNPGRPEATHVAVRDGGILLAGSLEEMASLGQFEIDDRFSDKVLMPGLVEGHAHSMEGALWKFPHAGWFDRSDPSGRLWKGIKTFDQLRDHLIPFERAIEDPDEPLFSWGFDPIYFGSTRLCRDTLDQVSRTRPIGVLHASAHILNLNSKALELAGLLKKGITHPGIVLGADDIPTGELKGFDLIGAAGKHVGMNRAFMVVDRPGLNDFGRLCVRAGVTTSADLGQRLNDETVDLLEEITGADDYPVYLAVYRINSGLTPRELVDYAASIRSRGNKRLGFGGVKVMLDGSIQGFSARLRWPGYHNGAENGLWYIAPDQLREIYERALAAGIQVHTHTNGDEATQLAIETLETALRKVPDFDHRFTLQHCQLASAAQFRKMARLGMCVNLFANHHFYWGDEHYSSTVGPERAERMNACRTALQSGVPMAIHSDAPITPIGPLFTAWAAVNRLTASGRVLGEGERISIEQALFAITMGAAITLKMDHLVGSIEVGKRADFAVLEEDPTQVAPGALKDVPVWGTVQGGRIFEAASI